MLGGRQLGQSWVVHARAGRVGCLWVRAARHPEEVCHMGREPQESEGRRPHSAQQGAIWQSLVAS